MGLKLLLVCGLALLMAIPALFVFALLGDRTARAEKVTEQIGAVWGGEQTFLGPVVAVPYTSPPLAANQPAVHGVYLVFPTTAQGDVTSQTELRQRSLFKVPVYTANLRFHSAFDLTAAGQNAPTGAVLDWSKSAFLVGVSDERGARSDGAFTVDGKSYALAPASGLVDISLQAGGDPNTPARAADQGGDLHFIGVPAAGIATPGGKFTADATLRFTGVKRLAVLAWGKATSLTMHGDWASPSFDGGFLPVSRTVTPKGFSASWTVPFLARGVPAEGVSDAMARLGQTALGVSFVEPANPYQSVARSLKYALLFVSLVFLAYFVFETVTGQRMHPAQYVLVGLTQVIFYLLLLAIAEQIGFDIAFLAAASATVSLISAYAGWVFKSRKQGFVAFVAFSLLYALIYVLMRLEDLALLVGALTSFAAIAAAMYFTRNIDWYGGSAAAESAIASKEAD